MRTCAHAHMCTAAIAPPGVLNFQKSEPIVCPLAAIARSAQPGIQTDQIKSAVNENVGSLRLNDHWPGMPKLQKSKLRLGKNEININLIFAQAPDAWWLKPTTSLRGNIT